MTIDRIDLATHSPTKYPTTATPSPTTNMSSPERNTLRPVNTERAAPTIQCDSIEIANETTIAVAPRPYEKWKHRNERADRRRRAR